MKQDKYIDYLLFLFADLYLLSKNIQNTINKNDFIILVGDTPSYLTFFLHKHKHFFYININILFYHLHLNHLV
jgi:hypothetical protein